MSRIHRKPQTRNTNTWTVLAIIGAFIFVLAIGPCLTTPPKPKSQAPSTTSSPRTSPQPRTHPAPVPQPARTSEQPSPQPRASTPYQSPPARTYRPQPSPPASPQTRQAHTAQPTRPTYSQPTTAPAAGPMVYYVSNGACYHSNSGCRSLARSSNVQSTSLSEAKAMGLRPCKNCYH